MGVHSNSPSRRKSMAVTNQNEPIRPKRARRAHSMAAANQSPVTKSRLSLGPVKGILKASLNLFRGGSQDGTQVDPKNTRISSVGFPSSVVPDDVTQSMDITQDFHAPIHDNFARKSMGRRVSFKDAAQVRVFQIPEKNHTSTTASTDSPQSSPGGPSSDDAPVSHSATNDENAYPGGRRSSVRYSMAGDMDLTSIVSTSFLRGPDGSAIDDPISEDDDDDDDMEVTEALNGEFLRKRSLSMGVIRRPLAQISAATEAVPHEDPDQSQSYSEDASQSYSDDQSGSVEGSEPVIYSVPLGQSLRPAHHDEAWMALRQMTHSGQTPYDPAQSDNSADIQVEADVGDDSMEVDAALARLSKARSSMSMTDVVNDSMSSMEEDSFGDDFGGDRTLNLSKVMGRISVGGGDGRMSMGLLDASMEESEVYGSIIPAGHSTPRQSTSAGTSAIPSIYPSIPTSDASVPETSQAPIFQAAAKTPSISSVFQPPPTSSVFSLPKETPASSNAPVAPPPISPSRPKSSASNGPPSPSKGQRKQFSAAFAPPVARPSPKKVSVESAPSTSTPSQSSPRKRPRSISNAGKPDAENVDMERPTPAKRVNVGGKWTSNATPAAEHQTPSTSPSDLQRPKPLSPSKRAPFQAPTSTTTFEKPAAGLRRPSGYYARRKSLGVGLGATPSASQESTQPVARSSPKKKPGLGLGRASVGSAPTDAWRRFSKGDVESDKGKGKRRDTDVEMAHCEREISKQAAAAPSPTRGSPAPASPRPARDDAPALSSPATPVLDLSAMLEPAGFGQIDVPMGMDAEATQQWREGVEDGDFEEEGPLISIEQFLEMTGIKFMDELTAPRRSIHPSQQLPRQPRNASEIPLSEFAIAVGIDAPQLVLYSRVSNDLRAWMDQSKAVFVQLEEEAEKMTPELFTEYSRADEEGQAELLHQLQLIRTNTRGLAKSDWYEWKLKWIEGLQVTADKAFASLETDAKTLEKIKAKAADVVPTLQREYDEIMRQLEKEQAEVADIEQCDQDYLNELKSSIAEQDLEVESLKTEVAEANDQIKWLQERMDEIELQKRQATTAITNGNRLLQKQKNSTRSEIFRLKDELEALEDLHMFRATKITADLFEYVYASVFLVSIPCRKFLPIIEKVDIRRLDHSRPRSKDEFPSLSNFLLSAAKQRIRRGGDLTTRQIVHNLRDYWSSCAQLRSQLRLLAIKYPLEIKLPKSSDSESGFKVVAAVLFPLQKAKAFVSFDFDIETFACWPMSVRSVRCEVEVAYGAVDGDTIYKAVSGRLGETTPADNYACLLDACIEAQEEYKSK